MSLAVPSVGDSGHVTDHDTIAGILNDPATNWPQGNATYVPGRVADAGTYGGGAVDASGHIQGLLDAANTAGGGHVVIPPGTFLINSNLTVYSNTTLSGAGRLSILKTTDSTDRTHVQIASGASNVVIWGIACVGPGDATVASGHEPNAINLIANCAQITVRGCFIKDIAGFGVGIGTGSTEVVIEGNHIEGVGNSGLADGHAISVESAGRLAIRNNTIRNCRYRGIEIFSSTVTGTEDVTVSGNTIYNTVATGIAVFASSSGTGFVRQVTVTGNTVDTTTDATTGQGIWVAFNADHVTVTANTIQNTATDGISVTPQLGGATIKKCAVVGNTVRMAGRYGIYTDGSTFGHLTISNNVVTSAYSSGIYLDNVFWVTLQGNICLDNGRQATGGADYAGIWGNTAANCTISGNICRDTRAAGARTQTVGIYLTNSSDNNTVYGNIASNNVNGQIILSGTSNTLYPVPSQARMTVPIGGCLAWGLPNASTGITNSYVTLDPADYAAAPASFALKCRLRITLTACTAGDVVHGSTNDGTIADFSGSAPAAGNFEIVSAWATFPSAVTTFVKAYNATAARGFAQSVFMEVGYV